MHFHPSRPDRLLGFNQSGELWAVVGKIDELIYMLPGGGITFMYNPDDNRTVGYITRIE